MLHRANLYKESFETIATNPQRFQSVTAYPQHVTARITVDHINNPYFGGSSPIPNQTIPPATKDPSRKSKFLQIPLTQTSELRPLIAEFPFGKLTYILKDIPNSTILTEFTKDPARLFLEWDNRNASSAIVIQDFRIPCKYFAHIYRNQHHSWAAMKKPFSEAKVSCWKNSIFSKAHMLLTVDIRLPATI